jgi:sulfatase modifying factor 1
MKELSNSRALPLGSAFASKILLVFLLAGLAYWAFERHVAEAEGMHCDLAMHNIHRVAASSGAKLDSVSTGARSPEATHAGMVYIPGGQFWMGAQDREMEDAHPLHQVAVEGFWMDRTTVTNAQFAQFVAATHYITVAERPLDPKEFPNVPTEQLQPGGAVFKPPNHPTSLDDPSAWWSFVTGANWRHPDGPASSIDGKENYPVVQVAWEDARAYANWAHKRLPSEAEFECAARGGLDRQLYAWGSDLTPGGKWQANLFQGRFPDKDTAEDGFAGRAPIGSFRPNGYGLFDMTGNVWQWCSDWYRYDYYKQSPVGVQQNPIGPADSLDPQEPGVPKRVQRGGSFLCTQQYCYRYVVGSRGKGDPNTSTNHVGFRCVASEKGDKSHA